MLWAIKTISYNHTGKPQSLCVRDGLTTAAGYRAQPGAWLEGNARSEKHFKYI